MIHPPSPGKLLSKAFWLGTALSVATLTVLSLPAVARKAYWKTPSYTTSQTQQHSTGRWIEVDLSDQRLIAWNGNTKVRAFLVSTGKRRTPTPTGTYAVQSKYSSARMQGQDYNVPNVPYTMYFTGGYAVHGAYWHNSFGTPISHGCVNLRVGSARWLYSWAPVGTTVVVHR